MELSDERIGILLEAVWELDKLARVLPDMVPLDDDQAHYAVRGIAGRILRLTHVLMGGLQKDDLTDSKMRSILTLSGCSQG